jgi:ferric-dicitrate binding protein FerR (iron transport regulator)
MPCKISPWIYTAADTIHVDGVFRIGDPDSFAHAMASAHELRVIERRNQIILAAH